MHKYIITYYNYGTAQFKLYTCMSVNMLPAQLLHDKAHLMDSKSMATVFVTYVCDWAYED